MQADPRLDRSSSGVLALDVLEAVAVGLIAFTAEFTDRQGGRLRASDVVIDIEFRGDPCGSLLLPAERVGCGCTTVHSPFAAVVEPVSPGNGVHGLGIVTGKLRVTFVGTNPTLVLERTRRDLVLAAVHAESEFVSAGGIVAARGDAAGV
jgi:hypothetical protein